MASLLTEDLASNQSIYFMGNRISTLLSATVGIVVVALVLSSCSASGPKYSEMENSIPNIEGGRARVFFIRPSKIFYSGADTRIKIDGVTIGKCPNGGFFYEDLAVGTRKVEADYWGSPGRFSIQVDLKNATTEYLLIEPRQGNVLATAILGPVGQFAEAAVATEERDGSFSLTRIAKDQAEVLLREVAYSRN